MYANESVTKETHFLSRVFVDFFCLFVCLFVEQSSFREAEEDYVGRRKVVTDLGEALGKVADFPSRAQSACL